MDPKKIERINELARKKRTVGLTEGEVQEQAALRQEYLEGFRANMRRCWTTCASSARTVPSNACKRNALTKSIPHFRGKSKKKLWEKTLPNTTAWVIIKARNQGKKANKHHTAASPNGDQVKTKQLELPAEW